MHEAFPGEEIVLQGMSDLSAGKITIAALLVSIGATRLRMAGLEIPPSLPNAEHRLYELLSKESGDDAHSRYNGLLRRLVSYERALECAK